MIGPPRLLGQVLLNLTPPPLDAQDDHLANWDRLRGDLERQRQLLHEEPSLQEEMEVLPPEKARRPFGLLQFLHQGQRDEVGICSSGSQMQVKLPFGATNAFFS